MKIKRVSYYEKIANSKALDCFMFSLVHPNIDAVKNVLDNDGEFLGKDKIMFLGKMNSFFYKLKNENIVNVSINRGICLDKMAGSDVLEIRYAKSSSFFDEFDNNPNELGDAKHEDEIVVRFSVSLLHGKVVRIGSARKYRKTENCQTDNLMLNLN